MKVEGQLAVASYEAGFEAGQRYYSDLLEERISDLTQRISELSLENDELKKQVEQLKITNDLLEKRLKG